MALESCAFETDRLLVREWHSPALAVHLSAPLEDVVASLLTEPVTRTLPDPWQGSYSLERARLWIEERDAEGSSLLVIDEAAAEPVGLVILFEALGAQGGEGRDLRLGYLLAERSWGKGYASELVAGLVGWCRGEPGLASITGGVGRDNLASRRVLEKNGFELLEDGDDEQIYRLRL